MQIDDQRIRELQDAGFEMNKLARVRPDMVSLGEGQAHDAVRGIAGRILRLIRVIMGGLETNEITDKETYQILNPDVYGQG